MPVLNHLRKATSQVHEKAALSLMAKAVLDIKHRLKAAGHDWEGRCPPPFLR